MRSTARKASMTIMVMLVWIVTVMTWCGCKIVARHTENEIYSLTCDIYFCESKDGATPTTSLDQHHIILMILLTSPKGIKATMMRDKN